MKRTFRACAIIGRLIERRFPGQEKSGRRDADLDRSRLRRAAAPPTRPCPAARRRADAATGLLDIRRLAQMLTQISGHIVHQALDHVSPLSVSVMLEIGREAVHGGRRTKASWRRPRR